ncbi:MAG: helix-turn-helix domain-containing protein [Tetrasphaera sp.]
MRERDYGQYCGLARALDVVGERWALLIVRDLLSGPRRFGELQNGLPRIPSNVLTNRLKHLEAAGVVERVVLPAPARGTAYALTGDGRALEETLVALGRWGALRLGEPRPGEIVTAESFAMALRTTFRPDPVSDPVTSGADDAPITYEIHLGDLVTHATVRAAQVIAGTGPAAHADLVIHTGPRIKEVMAGEVSPSEALRTGLAVIHGPRRLWTRFARTFRT